MEECWKKKKNLICEGKKGRKFFFLKKKFFIFVQAKTDAILRCRRKNEMKKKLGNGGSFLCVCVPCIIIMHHLFHPRDEESDNDRRSEV